jgi:hypothetical protein
MGGGNGFGIRGVSPANLETHELSRIRFWERRPVMTGMRLNYG